MALTRHSTIRVSSIDKVITHSQELLSLGSTFKIGHQVGLEIEQCQTLMKALRWTFEFVQYNNEIGHVLNNRTATGALSVGDSEKLSTEKFELVVSRLFC